MGAPKGNKNAKGNKGGRPTAYREDYPQIAYKLTILGATDEEMADAFGVSERTINTWKEEHVEFLQSITRGKQIANAEVAERLYQRAVGYEHKDTKFFQYQGEIIPQEIVRHYPPDVEAAKFFLKNRDPKRWRDRKDHSFREEPTEKVLDEMDVEERKALIRKYLMLDDGSE